MDRHSVRYQFEHRIIPKLFFEDKDQLIGIILNDKNVLFRIIDEIFSSEKVANPYSRDDFTIDAARITESVMMLKIIFPEPEEEPLCYCSYLFFDEKFEKLGYYCIEKEMMRVCFIHLFVLGLLKVNMLIMVIVHLKIITISCDVQIFLWKRNSDLEESLSEYQDYEQYFRILYQCFK